MQNLRLKAILIAAYCWASISVYLNILFKKILGTFIKTCPDSFIPQVEQRKHPFKILMAGMEGNKIITNKVKLYISTRWEEDYCNGKGGIDFHELGKLLESSFLWISYVLTDDQILDIGKKINSQTNKIYTMAINLKTNIIKKHKIVNKKREFLGLEEILFFQCPIPLNKEE